MGEYADELIDNGIMDEDDEFDGYGFSLPMNHVFKFDTVQRETDKAFLLVFGDLSLWFPKTQVTVYKEGKTVSVSEWLALNKVYKEGLCQSYRIL